MIKEKITDSIFPWEEDIPEEFRLKKGLIQREYLVGGELFRYIFFPRKY